MTNNEIDNLISLLQRAQATIIIWQLISMSMTSTVTIALIFQMAETANALCIQMMAAMVGVISDGDLTMR